MAFKDASQGDDVTKGSQNGATEAAKPTSRQQETAITADPVAFTSEVTDAELRAAASTVGRLWPAGGLPGAVCGHRFRTRESGEAGLATARSLSSVSRSPRPFFCFYIYMP